MYQEFVDINNDQPIIEGADFAGFEVQSFIKKSKSAEIYNAEFFVTGQPAIIKAFTPYDSSELDSLIAPDRQKLILNEITLLSRAELVAPRVLLAATGEFSFIAMEYLNCTVLLDFISEQRRQQCAHFDEKKALLITKNIAQALNLLQIEAEIVHRDVKPANILLMPDFEVKLIDFGFADSLRFGLDISQSRGCTPMYSSQEVLLENEVHPRGDIYSLGMILYELATGGEPLFTSTNARNLVVEKMFPMLNIGLVSLPIQNLVADMLGVNEGFRIESYCELFEAIAKTEALI